MTRAFAVSRSTAITTSDALAGAGTAPSAVPAFDSASGTQPPNSPTVLERDSDGPVPTGASGPAAVLRPPRGIRHGQVLLPVRRPHDPGQPGVRSLLRRGGAVSRETGRRVGGLTVQARYGGAVAARARKGLVAKFERQADPENVLPDSERIRRGALLHRAHMIRCAEASARSRRK